MNRYLMGSSLFLFLFNSSQRLLLNLFKSKKTLKNLFSVVWRPSFLSVWFLIYLSLAVELS